MDSQIYQNLRKLINVVDELRDVGLQQYINLPRICVVGTQSSGKSSVLESIVGLDFLPRGDGVVTRRPLELRLVHLSEAENSANDAWAEFENEKGKKYRDFQDVRRHIDKLTDEVAGINKGIIDDPIVLTVYATQCPDLSLIDLPGITRVPLKGSDQTDDIERLTREMGLRYAKDPRTIILAVIAANADMSTSDALQIARRVDPKGLRTIGVITKIDLMDRGTDAAKMLLGEEIPLRLGYTGVRNRSQADIKSGKSIREALEEEKAFFCAHPVYRALPPGTVGIRSLVDKLTKVLFRHIKSFLPEIKREISNRLRSVQERLHELGEGVPMENSERAQLLWTMVTDYCEIFKNTIRGKYDKRLQTYFEHQDITGGAQIRTVFNELLEEFVEKDVTADMEDYDIDTAIRMHEGDSLPGFPSPDTFEFLILPHLKKVYAPVIDCLDRVSQCLELLSQKIVNRVFGRFPRLAEQVLEQSQNILQREKDATKVVLENIIEAETGYLFTNDSKYLTDHGSMINGQEDPAAFAQQQQQQNQQQLYGPDGKPVTLGPDGKPIMPPTKQERAQMMLNSVQQSVTGLWAASKDRKKTRYSSQFIQEIRKRLDSYFSIVLRNVRDSVPKTIGYFLVRQLQEKLQFELYNTLNNESQFSALLGEPPHIVEERKSLMMQQETLRSSTQVLQRDPNIAALNLEEIDEMYDSDLRAMQMQAPVYEAQTLMSMMPSQQQHGGGMAGFGGGGGGGSILSPAITTSPTHRNQMIQQHPGQHQQYNGMVNGHHTLNKQPSGGAGGVPSPAAAAATSPAVVAPPPQGATMRPTNSATQQQQAQQQHQQQSSQAPSQQQGQQQGQMDVRKTAGGGLYERAAEKLGLGGKNLFEKEPVKRQAATNPLFSD